MKGLSLKNVNVGYRGKPVAEGIDASVSPGEVLILLGCNGAGKSTLIKSIAGLLPVLGGEVRIDGRELSTIPERERARIMSVLLSDGVKMKGMSCREVVELGRYPYTGYFGKLGREDERIVDELMETVGVTELAGRDYGKISDGQRQRVRLARCLVQEPEILLLDEPTVFLDVHYQAEFMALLLKYAKEKKIAVLMSMHDPELARCAADRLLCIKDGKVHAYGTPEELMTNGKLRSLYGLDELGGVLAGQPGLKAYVDRIAREESAT